MSSYRISQLAKRCGVPASTLRFYESAGLLPAERTASGYRVYGDAAVARLEFIASAKQLGLPLEEIRELLAVWQDGVCAGVRTELLPLVRAKMDESDRRIAELSAFSAYLAEVHEHLAEPAPAGACKPGCGCVSKAEDNADRASSDQASSDLAASDQAWRSQPVACTLDGSSMSTRVQDWRRLLASSTGREPITDGLKLSFPADPDLAVDLTRLAAAEQDCCAFLDFTLHLTPTALELQVRAPEAGAELLAELFAGQDQPPSDRVVF